MTDAAAREYTTDEMMTVAASRELQDGAVCFVGIGLPSEATNLARATHAPNCVLIYESGTVGAKPDVLPLSIGDGVLAEYADSVVSVPEIFNYWLQAGRVDVGFLGAAQMDRYGNINTTVIGPYESPKVRLPGAGGAPEIAASAREVVIILRQKPRSFVEETRLRHLGRAPPRRRLPQRARIRGRRSDNSYHRPWHLEARSRDQGAHDDRPAPGRHRGGGKGGYGLGAQSCGRAGDDRSTYGGGAYDPARPQGQDRGITEEGLSGARKIPLRLTSGQ